MALAETAKLIVDLSLQGNFLSQTSKVNRALNGLNAKLSKTEGRAYKAGQQIGTGIKRGATIAAAGVGILVSQVAFGLQSLIKLEGMTAQTEAVLKSTGGVAGVTAGEVRKLAEQYEALNATIGDEVIQNAENLLLTFTKVNKKAFQPALQAALDMNQALGGGPEGLANTTKLLGKALQDPEKGLSRLGRAVGGFDDATVKAVKSALKNNDTLKAQNIILAELERRYGGSFARAGETTAGKVAKFGDAIEDLQRSLAVALLPAVSNIADALTDLLADPEVIKSTEKLGREIGKLFSKDNIKDGIAALREGFGIIKSIAGPIADVVGTAVKAFTSLPPELQKLAVGALAVNKLTGGLVTNLAGGLISAVLSSFKGAMNVTAGVVNVSGGVGGGSGIGGGASVLGLIGPAAAAAIGAQAATSAANADLKGKGISGTFQTPGSGVLPFGIESSFNNIATALKLLREQKTPEAVKEASKTDSRATLQVEQATARSQKVLAAASAAVQTAVEKMKGKIAADLAGNKAAQLETKRETTKGAAFGSQGVAATQVGAAGIKAAIFAARPIITTNVSVSATNVTKVTQVTKRYGQPLGSRNQGNIGDSGAR